MSTDKPPVALNIELPRDSIPIVPMRNAVLFPHVLMPITVGREKLIAAVKHAVHAGTPLDIILQKDPLADDPGRDALCDIGPLAPSCG
jgi:ATP-dependent Lon protease